MVRDLFRQLGFEMIELKQPNRMRLSDLSMNLGIKFHERWNITAKMELKMEKEVH